MDVVAYTVMNGEENIAENRSTDDDGYRYIRVRKVNKSHKKMLIFTAVCVALTASAGFVGLKYYQKQQFTSQVPQAILQSANFPIYTPKSNDDAPAYTYSDGILSGTIKIGQSKITLTEQVRPADFELSKFISYDQLVGGRQLKINGNQALLGKVRQMNIAVMDTGKTIITLISPDQNVDLEQGLRSLIKI